MKTIERLKLINIILYILDGCARTFSAEKEFVYVIFMSGSINYDLCLRTCLSVKNSFFGEKGMIVLEKSVNVLLDSVFMPYSILDSIIILCRY